MTESITRIRGTGLPGPSPLGIMLPLLRIRPLYPPLFPSSPHLSFLFLSFSPLCRAFSLSPLPLSLSLPLFALHAFFSSFFKLIHPLLSFLEHQELLSFYRVDDPPSSAPFFFSLSPSYSYSRAYYVTRITIICFETASTAHQSE